MEDFKEKIPMIIATIIIIALAIGAYYILFVHKDIYYTQIDDLPEDVKSAMNIE